MDHSKAPPGLAVLTIFLMIILLFGKEIVSLLRPEIIVIGGALLVIAGAALIVVFGLGAVRLSKERKGERDV